MPTNVNNWVDNTDYEQQSTMTSSVSARVFASQLEACAWHLEQLPNECQSASLLDLAALWRARAGVLSGFATSQAWPIAPKLLTRVDAHAAPELTRALARLGCGARVRSRDELMSVVSSGLTGTNLLLDNPCKTRSLINLAKRQGVAMTTFDTESEAARLVEQWPGVSALLLVRSKGSAERLLGDATLGVEPDAIAEILAAARRLGLNVAGVAVADCCLPDGSEDDDNDDETSALLEAARLAVSVGRLLGHRMSLLDVGRIGQTGRQLDLQLIADFVDSNKIDSLYCDPTEPLLSRSVIVATRLVAKQRDDSVVVEEDDNNRSGSTWRWTVGDSTFGAFAGWRRRVVAADESPSLFGVVSASSSEYVCLDDLDDEDAVDVQIDGIIGSDDDKLGRLRQLSAPLVENCRIGDWLLWCGVGADGTRAGRLANGLAEPEFRCFLQSGRDSTSVPAGKAVAGSGGGSVHGCRTRHSSSCCYSESVVSGGNASSVNSNEQSSSEICCSVMLS